MARWLVDVPFTWTPPLVPLLLAIDAIRGQRHGFQPLNRDLLFTLFADSIATAFEAVERVIYCREPVFVSFD